jgi:hypothetical protein
VNDNGDVKSAGGRQTSETDYYQKFHGDLQRRRDD